MSNGHAPFPPSASKRWMACTASFGLGLQVPEPPESEYAADGTRLHDVAAQALRERDLIDADFMAPEDYATLAPYLKHVQKLLKAKGCRWHSIEERAAHSLLLYGTADFRCIIGTTLHVVDLKTGAGIMVDPEENEQLLTYAFMTLCGPSAVMLPVTEVVLTIVQPPDEAKPVKSWATTPQRVITHGVAAEAAIAAAIGGRGEFVPGGHCRFCKARAICPSLRGELVEALGTPSLPAVMTKASLAQWLDRAERLEGFIKDVREVAHRVSEEAIQTGTPGIPGWTLKPKRATRSWADEDKVLEIARRRKIKIWQDKLMSPAMAEKAHPNMPEELTKQIVAVSSGSNLVRGEATHVIAAPDAPPMAKLVANLQLKKF